MQLAENFDQATSLQSGQGQMQGRFAAQSLSPKWRRNGLAWLGGLTETGIYSCVCLEYFEDPGLCSRA